MGALGALDEDRDKGGKSPQPLRPTAHTLSPYTFQTVRGALGELGSSILDLVLRHEDEWRMDTASKLEPAVSL